MTCAVVVHGKQPDDHERQLALTETQQNTLCAPSLLMQRAIARTRLRASYARYNPTIFATPSTAHLLSSIESDRALNDIILSISIN